MRGVLPAEHVGEDDEAIGFGTIPGYVSRVFPVRKLGTLIVFCAAIAEHEPESTWN